MIVSDRLTDLHIAAHSFIDDRRDGLRVFNLKYTAQDGGTSLGEIARAAAVLRPGSAPGASPTEQSALTKAGDIHAPVQY